jgi:nicotinamide-nucleotide amidase
LGADFGIGITGIAGPGGGTPEKPVGTVCLCVQGPDGDTERTVRLPGGRAAVRDRTTTVALHLLLSLL